MNKNTSPTPQPDFRKVVYRILLSISFIALNGLLLVGLGALLAFMNTGADRADILKTAPKAALFYLPKVTWTKLDNPGREMREVNKSKIENDYLYALYVKNVAFQANDFYGVKDYYTEDAQKSMKQLMKEHVEQQITVDATTLNHQLELDFFSEDGQQVSFTDRGMEEYVRMNKNGVFAYETTQKSTYQVLMLLEDGFWRVRHRVKLSSESLDTLKLASDWITINQSQLVLNKVPFFIKGINYYPQHSPWALFGTEFNEATIDADFKIIKNASLNTVRIFLQYADFGKQQVIEGRIKQLDKVLALAQKHDLKAIVTLFDFYGDYGVLDWTLTHRHVEQIVTPFTNDTRILAWDIKNEPDLDFDSRGKENVLSWIRSVSRLIRTVDKNHLITVGWATPEAATNLATELDLISFHYYKDKELFEQDLKALKRELPNRPLVVQEFGLASYRGLWNPFGNTEQDQAQYHKQMQTVLTKEALPFISWTLYDFTYIPESVVGKLPWHKAPQKHFGFIDKHGAKKAAFKYINGL